MQAGRNACISLSLFNPPDQWRPFAVLLHATFAHGCGDAIDVGKIPSTHGDHATRSSDPRFEVLQDGLMLKPFIENWQGNFVRQMPFQVGWQFD